MALPELFANTPTPGVAAPITSLSGNGGSITATATTLKTAAAAPTALQASGQFRILIDQELLLVTGGTAAGGTTWTVTRGVEGTAGAIHNDGTAIYHIVTAGSLIAAFMASTNDLSSIASLNATAGNVSMNTHKLLLLSGGTAASDGMAFGQFGSTTTVSTTGSTVSSPVTLLDPTSGSFSITMPTSVGFVGRYVLRAINTNTNFVTVNTTSSQTIDGASSTTVGPQGSTASWIAVELVSDGSNWRSI